MSRKTREFLPSICSCCHHPVLHSRNTQTGSKGRHRRVWWSTELYWLKRKRKNTRPTIRYSFYAKTHKAVYNSYYNSLLFPIMISSKNQNFCTSPATIEPSEHFYLRWTPFFSSNCKVICMDLPTKWSMFFKLHKCDTLKVYFQYLVTTICILFSMSII